MRFVHSWPVYASALFFIAAVPVLAVVPLPQPATGFTDGLNINAAPVAKGCYSTSGSLTSFGIYTYQSQAWCQALCYRQGLQYMALFGGQDCYCGKQSDIPQASDVTPNSNCISPCNGYPTQYCGGSGSYEVFNTGWVTGDPAPGLDKDYLAYMASVSSAAATSTVTSNVPLATPGSTVATTSAAPATVTYTPTAGVVTPIQQTIFTTATAAPVKGTNTAAIAAGVVVGVVCTAALVGAVFFYLRSKKLKNSSEEHKHSASMTNFASTRSEKPASTYSRADSRLEPSFIRRMSDGSIADNQDYSRRILKVMN